MPDGSIQISAMQWSNLTDIADVPKISEEDKEVLAAIRSVLVEHNALGRFGIHLLHKHFEVKEDEILVEYTNVDERTHHIQVEKRTSAAEPDKRIETMWSFTADGATQVCDQQCVYNSGHQNRHYPRP